MRLAAGMIPLFTDQKIKQRDETEVNAMCDCHDHLAKNDSGLAESLEKEKANAVKGMLIEGGLELTDHFDMSAYSFLKGDPLPPPTAHPN